MPDTPSTHRQRLNLEANIGLGLSNATNGLHLGTPSIPRISPSRGPSRVGGINNGFAGYGMSAGLKVSHTPTPGPRLQTRTAPGPRGRLTALGKYSKADTNCSRPKTSFGVLWWQDIRRRNCIQWGGLILLTTLWWLETHVSSYDLGIANSTLNYDVPA